MPEIVTNLTGVEVKTGTTDKGPWSLSIFSSENGKYQTFDKALGGTAQGRIGQGPTRIVYHEETRGDFTNNIIDAIEAAPSGVTPPPQQQPDAGLALQQAVQVISEKDQQIHRQTAAKVAAELLQYFPAEERTIATFDTVCDRLVEFFNHGR